MTSTQQSAGLVVQLEQVSKKFGDRQILSGIDLRFEAGQFVAIVGRSGSGKSTLLRLVAGLDAPTSGRILLNDKPLTGLASQARMLFQDHRLLPWRKALANVQLGSPDSSRKAALELLDQVGLGERAAAWPRQLSGGERQRVALARALVNSPQLLLLDEPLGSVDALTRIEMQMLIESLWQQSGFTALLVTHDVEEAVLLGDRVLVIGNGQIERDISVDLIRPRRRSDPNVSQLVEALLDHLLGRETAKSSSARGG